jgi:hypothetical protein
MILAFLSFAPALRAQQSSPPADSALNTPSTQPAIMRFKRYVITDDQGFQGTEVFHGVIPVDWTVKGGVLWKMALGPPGPHPNPLGRPPGSLRLRCLSIH